MKNVRTIGVVLGATLLLMVLGSVGSASAAEKTVLCTEKFTPCGAGKVLPANTTIKGKGVVFKVDRVNPAGSVGCLGTTFEGETTLEKGGPQLTGNIATMTMSTCSGPPGSTCGVAKAVGLQYETLLSHTGSGAGLLSIYESKGGRPGFEFECKDGAFTVIDCTYRVNETNAQLGGTKVGILSIFGGVTPSMSGSKIAMTEEGPLCPGETPLWTASWSIEAPNPVWVSVVEQP